MVDLSVRSAASLEAEVAVPYSFEAGSVSSTTVFETVASVRSCSWQAYLSAALYSNLSSLLTNFLSGVVHFLIRPTFFVFIGHSTPYSAIAFLCL